MAIYFLYLLFSPLIFLFIHFYKFFNQKLFIHIKNEKQLFLQVLKNIDYSKKLLIFHAASAGEFEQLKPLLKKINRNKYFILQTFTSPTVYNQQKDSEMFDYCCYHPFDFIWKSFFFFKRLKPYKYIITRHDLWPNHILICNLLKIPIYFINANIHKNSIWKKPILFSFSNFIFKKINYILVPSKRIKDNLVKLTSNVIITGDSRFDQILERKKKNILSILPKKYDNTNNIIFGSYDLIDEKMILSSLNKVFPNGSLDLDKQNISIFLVPHEINNKEIKSLSKKLKILNFNSTLYTEVKSSCNVIIVDIVGILADLYKYSDVAYIGGGFTRGVHSVIEPAIYDCIIGFGPNCEMLDEAVYMKKNNLSMLISNTSDLQTLIRFILDKEKKESIKLSLNTFVKAHSGSTNKIIQGLNL